MASAATRTSFFAYDTSFTRGVYVSAGDLNGNGQNQIVTGPGAGGTPQVRVFNLQTSQLLNIFNAYDASFHGGVFVAVTDADSSGQARLVTGAGPGDRLTHEDLARHARRIAPANDAHELLPVRSLRPRRRLCRLAVPSVAEVGETSDYSSLKTEFSRIRLRA